MSTPRRSSSCAGCGGPLGPGVRFCPGCGLAVAAASPVAPAPGPAARPPATPLIEELLALDQLKKGGEILKSPIFLLLLIYGEAPLFRSVLGDIDLQMDTLAIWWGSLWAMIIFRLFADRDLHFGWAVAIFLGTFFAMPGFHYAFALTPTAIEQLAESSSLTPRFLGNVLGVGVREELFKCLPVLGLLVFAPRFRKPIHGLVLGMMSGIGFAVAENVHYVKNLNRQTAIAVNNTIVQLLKGSNLHPKTAPEAYDAVLTLMRHELMDKPTFINLVLNNVMRMMEGPFGHGVYSGIVGYFLAKAYTQRRVGLAFAGLGLAALLHGSFDALAGTSKLLAIGGDVVGFFLLIAYVLKGRGVANAQGLAKGMFSRTVARVAGPEPAAAAGPAPVVVPVGRAQLRGLSGLCQGRVYPVAPPLLIGRDSSKCGVHLDEETVSRQHAVIEADETAEGTLRIRKLSAISTLHVNQQPVAESAPLRPGDQILVGSSSLMYEIV